jgi:hypothetical protein
MQINPQELQNKCARAIFRYMNDTIDRKLRLGLPNAPDRAKLTVQRGYARTGTAQIKLASAVALILATISGAYPAWAQVAPQSAPQGSATVTQGGSVMAPAARVRTPEDIERDRDIAPQGNEPVEVPNHSTIPWDQYQKLKQQSGERTPGGEQGGPARK